MSPRIEQVQRIITTEDLFQLGEDFIPIPFETDSDYEENTPEEWFEELMTELEETYSPICTHCDDCGCEFGYIAEVVPFCTGCGQVDYDA